MHQPNEHEGYDEPSHPMNGWEFAAHVFDASVDFCAWFVEDDHWFVFAVIGGILLIIAISIWMAQ